jgi:uracil-DNA glycosylase
MSFQFASLADSIPVSWRELLAGLLEDDRLRNLSESVGRDRQTAPVFPGAEQVFAAFAATPPKQVRAVILGQDPYHGPGQAHGLSFSVPAETPLPPSLRNIFKELASDLGSPLPTRGDLTPWARQGVLLLNSLLTVRESSPLSHRGLGWEWFTDEVISRLSRQPETIVFLLWGGPAQKKRALIDSRQPVLTAAHPSPLSAHRGFFGSRPFSNCNAALVAAGRAPIDWLAIESPTRSGPASSRIS